VRHAPHREEFIRKLQVSSAPGPGEATLAGQVALVTGSGRGLGRAIAEHLVHLGADLAIHDSRTRLLHNMVNGDARETGAALLGANRRGLGLTGDITMSLQSSEWSSVHRRSGPFQSWSIAQAVTSSQRHQTNPTALWAFNSRTRALSLIATCSEPCWMCERSPLEAERQRGVIVTSPPWPRNMAVPLK